MRRGAPDQLLVGRVGVSHALQELCKLAKVMRVLPEREREKRQALVLAIYTQMYLYISMDIYISIYLSTRSSASWPR